MRWCWVIAGIALLLAGCAATRYEIKSSAFVDQAIHVGGIPGGSSFVVVQNMEVPNPLFDREVQSKVQMLLQNKGHRLTPLEEADYVVVYFYEIDAGRTVTTLEPIIVDDYPRHSRTRFRGRYGYIGDRYTDRYDRWSPSYITYVPIEYTIYTSRLLVKVLDAATYRQTQEDKVVWIGDTVALGENQDLRDAIDYLLAGTMKHFGQSTEETLDLQILEDDEDLALIRGSQ